MASNRYCIDLAKRGTAGCKECKVKIEKGIVRIAKIIPNPFTDSGGDMKQWFHVKCIFEKLSRARATTKKIENTDDLEGWDDLEEEHKPEVVKYIAEYSSSAPSKKTPQKKKPNKASKDDDDDKIEVDKIDSSPAKDDNDPEPTKDDTFRLFRKLCANISDVSEYKAKTALVEEFFTNGSDGESFKGNLYLWMKMLLPMVEKRVYNLQNKQLIKLFSEMIEEDQEEMLSHFEENGQVAETIGDFFENSTALPPIKKSTLYLQEVDKLLDELAHFSKEAEQSHILKKMAKKCTSNDLKVVIRLIMHDLRINAGPKHILNGIHPDAYEAFQASRDLKEIIRRCIKQRKSGNKNGKLKAEASLMTPVLPMLAMVCGSPMEPFKRFPEGFYVEVKYDGERVQLHKRGDEFSYFSRSLKPVMAHKVSHLKQYIPQAFPHGNNLIIDCEILLVDKEGLPLPFGSLGAHRKTAFSDANVCLFVFDCLQFNDENLMDKPLWERRKILENNMTIVPKHVMFSELKEIKSVEQLSKIINSVIEQGLEGLVMKGKDTVYEPGKRHWLKLKKDYLKGGAMADSADLVVLGGYYGTGRKGGIMSVFLMGCLNSKTGKWCTVTKVPGGDDETLERLNKNLEMNKIGKDPANVPNWLNIHKNLIPDFVSKNPKSSPVWAISGAEFSKSDVHTANGISIRFPRVANMRHDKTWKEATILDELQVIFEKSKNKSEIIGLAAGEESEEEDTEFEFCKSSQKEATESEEKRFKKEPSSDRSPKKLSKRKIKGEPSNAETEIEDVENESPPKKLKPNKGEKDSSKGKETRDLPNIFTDVKLYIPSSMENADKLKRYFLAYDGELLRDHQLDEATYILVSPSMSTEQSLCPKNATKVTVDWIWDCVKLQKMVSAHLYKPKI